MKSITEELKTKKPSAIVRTSAEIISAIQATSLSSRTIYAHIRGARQDLAELDQFALTNGNAFPGGTNEGLLITHNTPLQGGYLSILPFLEKATACRRYLEILTGSPEGKTAEAILQQLFAELEVAQECERLEVENANSSNQNLLNAKEAALADLQSRVDQHPLVVEATKKVAAFYRKGELVTS
jgi:hypothetical protein